MVDTIPPVATIMYSPSGWTSGDVVVIAEMSEDLLTPLTGWVLSGTHRYTKTFSANAQENLIFSDLAGNTGSAMVTVNTIDKDAPVCMVSYDPSTATTGNVTATLTGCNETTLITNNGGSTSYLFTGNGSFMFEFTDVLGNP